MKCTLFYSNNLFGWTNVISHVSRTVQLQTGTFIVLRILTQPNLRWSGLSWSHANGFCTLLKQPTARQTAIWAPPVFRILWRPRLLPHATKVHQLQTPSPSQRSASPRWVTPMVELVCDWLQRDLIQPFESVCDKSFRLWVADPFRKMAFPHSRSFPYMKCKNKHHNPFFLFTEHCCVQQHREQKLKMPEWPQLTCGQVTFFSFLSKHIFSIKTTSWKPSWTL